MPFSPKTKLEAKYMASFRCCWCRDHRRSIEVHHIIPEAEGGPNTLDNAATLCPNCHSDFGGNPEKRKEIRDRRDYLYQLVEAEKKKVNPLYMVLQEQFTDYLLELRENSNTLGELKKTMSKYFNLLVDELDPDNAQQIVSSVVNIPKPPFIAGSPCQMSGQPCPSSSCDGIMDVDQDGEGVICNKCGLPVGPG